MKDGELFYKYVVEAFNAFVKNHSDLEPKLAVSFESDPIETDSHAVYCSSTIENDEMLFLVSVSRGTISAIKSGLDLGNEDQLYIYKLRIYWIIHHEIAHWIWGHIAFYEEMGWITQLGMFDAKNEYQINRPKIPVDSNLTHSAELLADTFATIEVFNAISRYDDGDEYESSVTNKLIIFAIMTTVALFYGSKRDRQHTQFHPPWRLRAANILRSIFECFLADSFGENNLHAGMRITAAAINPYLKEFTEKSLLPAWESANIFSNSNGLDEAVFNFEEDGIISPQKMMGLLTRNAASHPDVRKLLQLYKKANFWVEKSATYSPVNNFTPTSVFGEKKSFNPKRHQYKIVTSLSQREASKKLVEWARSHKFTITEMEFQWGSDELKSNILIDFEFVTMEAISKNDVIRLMNALQKDIM